VGICEVCALLDVGLPLLRGRKLKPSLGTAAGTAGSCGVRLRLCREKRTMELWGYGFNAGQCGVGHVR
jgi:hypothetical protein